MENKDSHYNVQDNVQVRPVGLSDLEKLAEMTLYLVEKSGHTIDAATRELMRDVFISRKTLDMQKPGAMKTVLAVNGNDIITGFVEYIHDKNIIEIDSLYVEKEYQNMGVAKALVRHVEVEAQNVNAKEINVVAVGDAVGFFKKTGFAMVNPPEENQNDERFLVAMTLVVGR
jgi:N-acetylglutamate synthase-like GNAT family acetyltransferase